MNVSSALFLYQKENLSSEMRRRLNHYWKPIAQKFQPQAPPARSPCSTLCDILKLLWLAPCCPYYRDFSFMPRLLGSANSSVCYHLSGIAASCQPRATQLESRQFGSMITGIHFRIVRSCSYLNRAIRHRTLTSIASTSTNHLLEEETLPWYKPDQFYPVRIGQTFESKYMVIGKLGYGAYSTVWLCRDIRCVFEVALCHAYCWLGKFTVRSRLFRSRFAHDMPGNPRRSTASCRSTSIWPLWNPSISVSHSSVVWLTRLKSAVHLANTSVLFILPCTWPFASFNTRMKPIASLNSFFSGHCAMYSWHYHFFMKKQMWYIPVWHSNHI